MQHSSALLTALLFMLVGGFVNGSFALPTRYMNKWQFENTWLAFVFYCFILFPWIVMWCLGSNPLPIYAAAPASVKVAIVLGGFVFGAGQCCFALALNTIGLTLGFVINIGLAIVLGSLLPLYKQPDHLLTPFGIGTLIAIALAVVGLKLYYFAGKRHHQQQVQLQNLTQTPSKKQFTLGVLLAVFAGFASASQNYVFSVSYTLQQMADHQGMHPLATANILWPAYLLFAAVPYTLFLVWKLSRQQTWGLYSVPETPKYILFSLMMSACWYGSLLFYSKAAQMIGPLGPVVGWPLFMVTIILTSNYWGWRQGEWTGSAPQTRRLLLGGVVSLVLSVLVLGYCASLA